MSKNNNNGKTAYILASVVRLG